MKELCSFAFPGTYGHECGAPATLVGSKPTRMTHSGIYYARRCANCASIKGGENTGLSNWEPLDSSKHVNDWNGRYSDAA